MNQTPIYWKRQNAAYIYADSEWGTAEGDGTQQKPFQTLEQVFEYLNANFYNTAAKVVVLRGYFPLTKTFMDYMCTSFVADKPFDAIVDGMNANGLLYCTNYDGLVMRNMKVGSTVVFRNTNAQSTFNGFGPLCGAGRANNANAANGANHANGVCSSPVLIEGTQLFRGQMGSQSSNTRQLYRAIPPTDNGIFAHISRNAYASTFIDGIYEGLPTDTVRGYQSQGAPYQNTDWQIRDHCLFSNWATFLNCQNQKYQACFFDADCKFYYSVTPNNDNSAQYLLVMGDPTATKGITEDANAKTYTVDGCATVDEMVRYVLATKGSTNTTFDAACVFSETEHKADIFNDEANSDYTLKETSAAANDGAYFGAFPPALHIRTLQNSDGQLNCWDHRRIDGASIVINSSNKLCIDTSQHSSAKILSKVIRINPSVKQLDGLWSLVLSKKNTEGYVLADNQTYPFLGNFVQPSTDGGTTGRNLEAGKWYIVCEEGVNIEYNGNSYQHGGVFLVPANGPLYYESESSGQYQVRELLNPGQPDVVYIRCRSMIYKHIAQSVKLIKGVNYINDGNKTIHLAVANRDIVAGEDFVCTTDNEYFSCTGDAAYQLGIIFDDRSSFTEQEPRQVPAAEDWVPAIFVGDYFVSKAEGVITRTADNVPEASGNPKSYANDTRSISGTATIINQPYVQLKIVATYIGEH